VAVRTKSKSTKKTRVATKTKSKAQPVIAYCMKCRDDREVESKSEVVQLVSGRKLRYMKCTVCGTSIVRAVAGDTPVDRIQTKREAAENKERRVSRNKESLAKLAAAKKSESKAKSSAKTSSGTKSKTSNNVSEGRGGGRTGRRRGARRSARG
jgi:hypothetical protein